MTAIEELEKLASEIDNEWDSDYNAHDAAARIRDLLPRLRAEVRDGKREAFVACIHWMTEAGWLAYPADVLVDAKAEIKRRYP